MYFPAKKDTKYKLLYWGPLLVLTLAVMSNLGLFTSDFISGLSMTGYLVIGFLLVLMSLYVWIWFTTGYHVESGTVKIKSGPFRQTIKIEDINQLGTSTNNPLLVHPFSGPALSIERIEIHYGKQNDVVNISPASRRKFVEALIGENDQIRIDTIRKQPLFTRSR